MNGRHASRLRGRGLNFEELRGYVPSNDDVRSIDWKVTARTGKPHVRVFTEERDRPALVVVDQRMSMFFGSTHNMKSVTAAEVAAIAAFAIHAQGDRIGGIVFGDQHIAEVRPQRNRSALNRLLTALADANTLLSANAPSVEPISLSVVLKSVASIAARDHLVIVISDFDVIDEATHRLVSGLSRHNDLVLALVSDPIAQELPRDWKLTVSDGTLQSEFDTTDGPTRTRLSDAAKGRLATVLDWQRSLGVPVLPLSSGEQSLAQVQRLLGHPPR